MRGQVSVRFRPTLLLAVVLLTGCSGRTERFVDCAFRARLDGRWYAATGAIRVIPEYGRPLGSAIVPPCGSDEGFSIDAVAIKGVNPEVAFASAHYEDIVFLGEGTETLPGGLKRLRDEPTCVDDDAPIDLHGPWLGIVGPHNETEVDLVPPYDLEMRVDEASAARYERVFLTIHVSERLGRPLSREDVRSSLWEGGTVSVAATCVDGEFWAEQVTASPPS